MGRGGSSGTAQRFDGVGFVVFDRNVDLFGFDERLENGQSVEQFPGVFQHHPVVAGQKGLTFAAVEHEVATGLVVGQVELDVRRKGRTAEPHDTGLLQGADKALAVEGGRVGHLPACDLLGRKPIGANADALLHLAVRMVEQADGFDFAVDRRVEGDRHEPGRLGYLLAPAHALPLAHDRFARRADMLRQRQGQRIRKRQAFDRALVRQLLVVVRMHPMLEGQ